MDKQTEEAFANDHGYITRGEALRLCKDIMLEAEKRREEKSIGIIRSWGTMPELDAITNQTSKIADLEALVSELRRNHSVTIKQMTGTEELLKRTCEDRDYWKLETKRPVSDSKEVEQLRVQLAGCGVAALGGTSESQLVIKGDYGWSPAYQSTLELRLKYDELAGTVERQKRHLEIKDAEIKKLQVENADQVKARKDQVERIDHLVEKVSLKDSIISGLVDDVKKAKGRFLDVVARDDGKEIEALNKKIEELTKEKNEMEARLVELVRRDDAEEIEALKARCVSINNEWCELHDAEKKGWLDSRDKRDKEIARLEKELSRQQKVATELFDECKRLQEERTQFLIDYGFVVEECGKLRSTKLNGAPTWPQYKQKRGPEMEPEEIDNMMAGAELAAKAEDKKKIIATSYDPAKVKTAVCFSCQEVFKFYGSHPPSRCQKCSIETKEEVLDTCWLCGWTPITAVRDEEGYPIEFVKCQNDKCENNKKWVTPAVWRLKGGLPQPKEENASA